MARTRDRSGSALSARGSTSKWRRIRQAVLDAAAWQCQIIDDTGQLCGAYADHCGHIIARSDWPPGAPGIDSWGNLRAECKHHSDSLGGWTIANQHRGWGNRPRAPAASYAPPAPAPEPEYERFVIR